MVFCSGVLETGQCACSKQEPSQLPRGKQVGRTRAACFCGSRTGGLHQNLLVCKAPRGRLHVAVARFRRGESLRECNGLRPGHCHCFGSGSSVSCVRVCILLCRSLVGSTDVSSTLACPKSWWFRTNSCAQRIGRSTGRTTPHWDLRWDVFATV